MTGHRLGARFARAPWWLAQRAVMPILTGQRWLPQPRANLPIQGVAGAAGGAPPRRLLYTLSSHLSPRLILRMPTPRGGVVAKPCPCFSHPSVCLHPPPLQPRSSLARARAGVGRPGGGCAGQLVRLGGPKEAGAARVCVGGPCPRGE